MSLILALLGILMSAQCLALTYAHIARARRRRRLTFAREEPYLDLDDLERLDQMVAEHNQRYAIAPRTRTSKLRRFRRKKSLEKRRREDSLGLEVISPYAGSGVRLSPYRQGGWMDDLHD